MANTLTNLIPAAYAALDNISRELVGLIPSVNRDMTADRVAKDQTLYIPVAPVNTVGSFTPAATVTAASDQTVSTKSLTISTFAENGFNLTGEEVYSLDAGPGSGVLVRDMIEQALRVQVNTIEAAIFTAAKSGASRAYGTAGTTPFDSTNKLAFTAQLKKILDDNGAPMQDRSMVIDTTAGAALRTLTQLTNVNESGTAMSLRDGELLNLHGFSVKESAQLSSHTAGTGTSYQLSAALAVGDTTVAVDTGSGTILAGDVVTIGSHKYVVATALATGSFTINAPGIRAVVADNTAITVNAAHTKNLAFSRNAILLATRIPKSGNDSKSGSEIITDPRSGLSFEIATYPGYGMEMVKIRIAYGLGVIKNEHLAVLLG